MIFVTIGAQMPFDRLLRTVDEWARSQRRHEVFAQIGDTRWRPQHMKWATFLDPIDYRERLFETDLIVAHAGMGTILSALEFATPILVLPRRFDLRETRNDHQFDTARAFAQTGQIAVALSEDELAERLNNLITIPVPERAPSHASFRLLSTLRQFIQEDGRQPIAQTEAPVAGTQFSHDLAPLESHGGARKAA